ncbi:MAG: hypothetical protein LUG51_05090 [Tannerellaceae bacterium]|nr:hypothetical protein [Tannerellaceae bacterium]
MKYLEPVLSFIVTVARILFSGKRRKPLVVPVPIRTGVIPRLTGKRKMTAW